MSHISEPSLGLTVSVVSGHCVGLVLWLSSMPDRGVRARLGRSDITLRGEGVVAWPNSDPWTTGLGTTCESRC